MASGRKQPPDKSGTKYYKCHPNTPVATVICIIYGGAYHKSDFERLDNTKYVEDNMVLCPKHVHVANITYNEGEEHLSETARIIITCQNETN